MPRDKHGWFFFKDGAKMGNATVEKYLEQAKGAILEDGLDHERILCGDTLVVAHRFGDYVDFIVSQGANGHARITIKIDDLPNWNPHWERPESSGDESPTT